MASKISKRSSAYIKGTLSIEVGKLLMEVEDVPNSIDLANFLKDFDGLEVTVAVAHKTDDIGGEEI